MLCAGGTGASANSNIYNNGGLVPGTHYSKVGVSACYGFHAAFKNGKINTRGKYQLRGTIKWKLETPWWTAHFTISFTFNFIITEV